MNPGLFVLIILPAFSFASIHIHVTASGDEAKAEVERLGTDINIISHNDRESFKINDVQLKQAIKKYLGGYPTDAYLHSPTPWNDLYISFGWLQVHRILRPVGANILGLKSEPIIVDMQKFVNNSTLPARYNIGISQKVQTSLTNSWSKSNNISVENEITYGIDIMPVRFGGTTSFSYKHSWGESGTETRDITLGTTSGVEVELQPGQAVVAELSATRGTMRVEVEYEASLDGDVACNFENTFRGHHFWKLDINAVLKAADLPRKISSKELLKTGFYSDGLVKLTDRATRRLLHSAPALFSTNLDAKLKTPAQLGSNFGPVPLGVN